MTKLQFRVLYREFLFRIVDIELLSAQADTSKLLGQLGGVLGVISLILSLGAFFVDSRGMPRDEFLIGAWGIEHFLISTTMLVVGLFGVLSWDSMFPTKTDVLILAPLPVSTRTLVSAKISAVATALGVAVLALNIFTGLAWPLALGGGQLWLLSMLRTLLAYWLTMVAAGTFVFCCVLAAQGLTAQFLPYWLFLRSSGLFQIAAFASILSLYFLEPHWATPAALGATASQTALRWLPAFWFLGLFQLLNGSMHPALALLATRALLGLGYAISGAAIAFGLSYFRTIRKIVEQPDVAPKSVSARWTPRFGTALQTAVAQFTIRSLLRSRQHRAILCFYLGVGFAITIFYLQTNLGQQALRETSPGALWHQPSVPLLMSSVVMMCMTILGIRVAFTIPLELRANWIFQLAPLPTTFAWGKATRRALWLLGVAPICIASALLLFSLWHWLPALGHLCVLVLFGTTLVDVTLYRFQKIPFTCSYLPGKSNVYFLFWAYVLLAIPLLHRAMRLEAHLLQNGRTTTLMFLALAIIAALARWRTNAAIRSNEMDVRFEEVPEPALFTLNLHKDGVL